MHRSVLTLLLALTIAFSAGQSAAIDSSSRLRVYVWEFSTQHTGEDQKALANRLTEDFETEVIQAGFYEPVEVRERSRLEEQRELQEFIFHVDELSDKERTGLQERRADAVFFGKLIYNEQSRENTLEVKLQHMDGRIIRKGSLYIDPSDLIMNESRRKKVRELFEKVHEDIYERRRREGQKRQKEQYERVSQKLNEYMMRLEDLTTQFRRLDLSLLSQAYIEEYNQRIRPYNESIEDIIQHHAEYESDFGSVWGDRLGEKLAGVFDKILDFHRQHIYTSLERRNQQIVRFGKAATNREKKELEEELKKEKEDFEETMSDQWPVVRSDIERFLYDLRNELN